MSTAPQFATLLTRARKAARAVQAHVTGLAQSPAGQAVRQAAQAAAAAGGASVQSARLAARAARRTAPMLAVAACAAGLTTHYLTGRVEAAEREGRPVRPAFEQLARHYRAALDYAHTLPARTAAAADALITPPGGAAPLAPAASAVWSPELAPVAEELARLTTLALVRPLTAPEQQRRTALEAALAPAIAEDQAYTADWSAGAAPWLARGADALGGPGTARDVRETADRMRAAFVAAPAPDRMTASTATRGVRR